MLELEKADFSDEKVRLFLASKLSYFSHEFLQIIDFLQGALNSLEKAYEIFFRTKRFRRIFDGFFLETKGFLQKGVRDFWE